MIQETSLRAYWDVVDTLGLRQYIVFQRLSAEPMTNTELSDRLGWAINTVTPRVYELREKGLVGEQEKRTCKITGKKCISWHVIQPRLEQSQLFYR